MGTRALQDDLGAFFVEETGSYYMEFPVYGGACVDDAGRARKSPCGKEYYNGCN